MTSFSLVPSRKLIPRIVIYMCIHTQRGLVGVGCISRGCLRGQIVGSRKEANAQQPGRSRGRYLYISHDKHRVREQRSVSSAYDLARSNRGFSIAHTSFIFYRRFTARLSSRESRIVPRISLDDVPWDRCTGYPRRFAFGAILASKSG